MSSPSPSAPSPNSRSRSVPRWRPNAGAARSREESYPSTTRDRSASRAHIERLDVQLDGLVLDCARRDLVRHRVGDRHLVPAGVRGPPPPELLAVPEALPNQFGRDRRPVEELVEVLDRLVDVVAGSPVAQRHRCDLAQGVGEPRIAEQRRVPGQQDRVRALLLGHQVPTSAWTAPGPSALRPWPSSVAPTRIAILPRCLLSFMSWCASATPSKPIVRQSTGRIRPRSMSSLALLHSYALAKCEPSISFWRIHR